ncbi:DUF4235 domain-containing protein [Arthrobacter sp. EH-1B-1]|uniref:DUF4235 domain-containing protein n=1 Tax=Arthrobacter vasquezii TaxID=2977629 RepID=A0ABT6CS55_9MICC|nr:MULTISPECIES: DUF4235 domain-containing protein [Arthrobacter]KRF08164.1 hypothetical protein ASH00_00010 [Arthrobacter sp. Soil782]MDF9276748.1 DUF4235 domain-containing protein [Arthrobacter vasquezii]
MNTIFKLMGVGLGIGAGLVGTQLVDFIWKRATGNEPPKDKEGLENSLRSALAFAVISGSVSTTIRVLTNRTTQRAIHRYERTRHLT